MTVADWLEHQNGSVMNKTNIIFLIFMTIGQLAHAQGKFYGGDGGGGVAVELLSIALPVELVSFSGSRNGDEIELNWRTAVEIGHNTFYVQTASSDGRFSDIGIVEALNLLSGSEYHFKFPAPSNKGVIYCRLKMVDERGEELSNVLSFRKGENSQVSLFPNPCRGKFRVVVGANASRFELHNAAGQVVYNRNISDNAKELEVQVGHLPLGTYYFVLFKSSGERCKPKPVFIR